MAGVTHDDIVEAKRRIDGYVRATPLLRLEAGSLGVDELPGITLKLELTQHAGSFKARGAHNLLLARTVPPAGVVAASGGNFGLAVAHAAGRLGHQATIFVPDVSSPTKVERLRRLGADVVIGGAFYADAYDASVQRAADTGALLAHAYDQPEVVAGAGTCAAELDGQAPDATTVLVAVGGGGLIGGVAAWYGDRARIVAVESEGTPTLHAALAAGQPVDVEVSGLAADSLGARRIGEHGFAVASRHVDDSVLVSDAVIADTQRRLWEHARIAAEPGGAAALAALVSGAYRPGAGEVVAVLVCGGNVDPASLTATPPPPPAT